MRSLSAPERMTNTNSYEGLGKRIERLVAEHIAASRKAAQDAVERAFASTGGAPVVAARRSRSTENGKRRASADVAALAEGFYRAVCARPGETMTVLAPEVGKPVTIMDARESFDCQRASLRSEVADAHRAQAGQPSHGGGVRERILSDGRSRSVRPGRHGPGHFLIMARYFAYGSSGQRWKSNTIRLCKSRSRSTPQPPRE